MPVASNLNNLAGLNAVVAAKGGALTYLNEINALNSIDLIETGAGGYLNGLSALNSIDVLLGGVGGYENELAVLNSVVVLEGGVGGWLNTIDAINDWVDNAGGGIVYLLDDQFTDGPVADPISSPRNAVPGPGKLVVAQDAGVVEITAADELEVAGNGAWNTGTCIWTDDDDNGFTVVAGLVNKLIQKTPSNTRAGFSPSTDPGPNTGPYFNGYQLIAIANRNATPLTERPNNGLHTTFIVLRNPGVVFLWINASDELEVLWFVRKVTDVTLWPCITARNVADKITCISNQVYQALGSSWATTTAMLDHYVAGSFSDPETFTHAADAQILFTAMLPAESIDTEFRRQDNDNKWLIRYDGPSKTLKIIEVTTTIEVERASVATGNMTATKEYTVIFKGTSIRAKTDMNKDVVYTGATAFQTETDGRIVGATSTQTHLEVMRLNLDGTQRATDLGL